MQERLFMARQAHPKRFFTGEEEARIIQAIKEAEKATSGEIRVHLVKEVRGDPFKDAVKIFNRLKMYKTRERNGCLILIGLKNKRIAVVGDKGIHDKVGDGFWDDVISLLINRFKNEEYTKGLVEAILKIGEKLKVYFPYTLDDVNELPDEISKED